MQPKGSRLRRADDDKRRSESDGSCVPPAGGEVRGNVWLLVLAIGLVAAAFLIVLRPTIAPLPEARPAGDPGSAGSQRGAVGPENTPLRRLLPPRAANPLPPRDRDTGQRVEANGSTATAGPALAERAEAEDIGAAAIDATESDSTAAGVVGEPKVPEGIWAFPPLGSNPPKPGIIVPSDYELPPGYVRHYQTTDDGTSLEAILMYHPDRPPLDEHGEPIEVPADRIVPPSLAPPGLPIEVLEVPEPQLPEFALPEGFDPEALNSEAFAE